MWKKGPFHTFFIFPVVAEEAEDVKRTYVAAVKVGSIYHFTNVEDGASSVKYADELGDLHKSHEFLVLAGKKFRYINDNQRRVPYLFSTPEWHGFWPVKDPTYRAQSKSARRDDLHLESLLNSYHQKSVAESE